MRLIGTVDTETDAQRLGDYLLAVGLPSHIEPNHRGAGWLIWIERDDDIEQGQLRLREYQANPNDPRYDQATAAARNVRRQAEEAAERRRQNYTDVRTSWSGLRIRPQPVAQILLAICVIIGALTLLGQRSAPVPDDDTARPSIANRIQEALVFQPVSAIRDPADPQLIRPELGKGHLSTMFSSVASGQVWRLVTPIFLHGDIIHLAFNMLWVWSLGRLIEARKGSAFMIGFVLIAALLSCTGEALWTVYTHPNGYVIFAGFSGVNYAFFGYAWMKGKFQPYEGIGVNPQTVGLLMGWLVLCMIGVIPDIANTAHVVGLIVGVIAGYWPTWRRRSPLRLPT